tara:strand:- start:609 stop:974 length:366 start_codon:yes stop_codon:yes gene_type:complete
MRINTHKENGIGLLAGVKSLRSILIISTILMGGCSILPFPVNHVLSAAHTIIDVSLHKETGKTSAEHLASRATKKDCQFIRIIDSEPACMTKEEEIDYILSKNCETITWNMLGLPRCKEEN